MSILSYDEPTIYFGVIKIKKNEKILEKLKIISRKI